MAARKKSTAAPIVETATVVEKVKVEETVPVVEETVGAEKTEEAVHSTLYTLTRSMNVRKKPSIHAARLKVLDKGATVEVAAIKDDWLYLTDGTFILYENGRNATKN